jgi:signal transduction histidine kinase
MSVDISQLNIALITICLIVFFLIGVFVFFVAYQRRKHNDFIKEKESLSLVYQQTLLQTKIEIQEQVFNQISQEIHDNIGQLLSVVRLQLNTLPLNEEETKPTDDLLGKAIQDLRNLSHTLSTDIIRKEGIVLSIQRLLESISRTGKYLVDFSYPKSDLIISSSNVLILYRIIQESITNIVKHAKASTIKVHIFENEDNLHFDILDDGVGYDVDEAVQKGGAGHENMYKRAALIGATIQLTSEINKGSRIRISIATA